MNQTLNELIEDLSTLSTDIENLPGQKSDNLFSKINITAPPMNKRDLALMPLMLADKLRTIDDQNLTDISLQNFEEIKNRLFYVRQNILASGFFHAQNITSRVSALTAILQWIDFMISPICNNWQNIDDNSLPTDLATRLRKANEDFNSLIKDKESFAEKVTMLYEAGPLLKNLEDKLKDIQDLENEIETFRDTSEAIAKTINTNKEESDLILKQFHLQKLEADTILKKANDAYRMATTVGLAGSFDKRAESLKVSQGLWLLGLIASLVIGGWIGHNRFEAVQIALQEELAPGYIWILIFLSILSFGAPIWFAWLATKQIGQRFKLSEDYAFKASVAKAYEGYRKEAASIDKEMEARLFASALTRLDELPLRFMDKETHGSPWQEFLNNPNFLKLFREKPEILEKMLDIAKNQLTKDSPDIESKK